MYKFQPLRRYNWVVLFGIAYRLLSFELSNYRLHLVIYLKGTN